MYAEDGPTVCAFGDIGPKHREGKSIHIASCSGGTFVPVPLPHRIRDLDVPTERSWQPMDTLAFSNSTP